MPDEHLYPSDHDDDDFGRETNRNQWFKHGDHSAVLKPKEPHLQNDPAGVLLNCGILPTPSGDVLVCEGDWIVTLADGTHTLERAEPIRRSVTR